MGATRWHEDLRRFVGDYTAGVGPDDLGRLFRRDAAEAYEVLTREQAPVPVDATGPGAFFRRAKVLFLGLSYTLSPPRRVLFAGAILLALVAGWELDVELAMGRVVLRTADWALVASVAALVFLLALELVDRVRVRDELEVARQLQRELLPQAIPPVGDFRFAHSYRTANAIGGDYYDVVPLADGRAAVVAGDASGHGIAAGLLMVIAHSTLRLALDLDPRPAAVLDLLNRALERTGGRRAFMSLFYGLLDPASGRLAYASAGHPFPLLRRADGTVVELGRGGLPLGLRRELEMATDEVVLGPGDLLVLYSDGFPEAVGAAGEAFGFGRLAELAAEGGGAEAVHARIVAALDAFLGGEAPVDDVSLLVLERARPAVWHDPDDPVD